MQLPAPTPFRYGPMPAQHVLWRPGAEGDGGPLLAIVHGGGWAGGDADGAFGRAAAAFAAARGWASASIEHRVLPEADPGEQALDVACALLALQRRTTAGDASTMVVLAHSAGAHLTALVHVGALQARVPELRPWRASILLDSAAIDVERLMQGPHLPLHDRAFGADPHDWQAWSPLAQVRERCAPMLLLAQSTRIGVQWMNAQLADVLRRHGGVAEVGTLDLPHARMHEGLVEGGLLACRIETFLRALGPGAPRSAGSPGARKGVACP